MPRKILIKDGKPTNSPSNLLSIIMAEVQKFVSAVKEITDKGEKG